jgi:hypothetical protein
MPTAWLILMNSRLSAENSVSNLSSQSRGGSTVRLVQRRMKRLPSRTKSLGISASSWKVSDIVDGSGERRVNWKKESLGELERGNYHLAEAVGVAFLGRRIGTGITIYPSGA